ncbi:hypothetical protein JYU34_012923 [Plutella xylostella]|uniref:tRNA-splicing endonuclease subunit Sen54 N-terminal domain-containing protein n=1 Tax=Plutella xylostella TaxID=51655 RepID=A0ABQ7QCZ4_PLUXY|nr:hypothetical protein JYU34_012923 [Plutella xylostella]
MRKSQIISGEDLVAKGATKIDASLPEVGLKDVIPNGSWLEQKQIQSAVEARKHLIEVPRIDKCGVLSHANWNEELGLAEVTQQVGGYWSHLGHHDRNQLYLNPEEALYLMETNCLHLKYNEVTVSLQQAYSLLLRGKISIIHYKVYASLSRVGYKVFRHDGPPERPSVAIISDTLVEDSKEYTGVQEETEGVELRDNLKNGSEPMVELLSSGAENANFNDNASEGSSQNTKPKSHYNKLPAIAIRDQISRKEQKLMKLRKRTFYSCSRRKLDKYFENLPELCQKSVVTINVPEETNLPRNIFLNNTSYALNLDHIKTGHCPRNNSRTYSMPEDVSDAHVRRIRSSSSTERSLNAPWAHPMLQTVPRFQQYWPYGPRPRQAPPFSQLFNFIFQRSFQTFENMPPRIWQRNLSFYPQQRMIFQNAQRSVPADSTNRKRSRASGKQTHLDSIKRLSTSLKRMHMNGNAHPQNQQALHRLINTFNIRYKTRLCLNADFELVNEENIVDTINLEDDEEEPANKKAKQSNSYEENLKSIKDLARKLKELDDKGKSSSRHRRAFSSMLNNFNKTYKADVYLDSNYDVIDRSFITLDSSESDCVVDEPIRKTSGKKLINPFNVLRRQSLENPSTSKEGAAEGQSKYADVSKVFPENWLPPADDFGRPEIVSKVNGNYFNMDVRNEEYLYEFIQTYKSDYKNWTDIKMSFWETVDDRLEISEEQMNPDVTINSLVKLGEHKDMASVLEKLRVIETCKELLDDTEFVIHFDVFNRDVPNFRKSDRPIPHFRILCVDEKSSVPTAAEVATVYSKYDDKVPIVFAVVGMGSISYLQLRPTDLPVYIPSSEVI